MLGAAARARQTLSESFDAAGTIQAQRTNIWSFKLLLLELFQLINMVMK